jgi:hypothetical protein
MSKSAPNIATMRTLTPANCHFNLQVSPLFSFKLLIIPSSNILYNPIIALSVTLALLVNFRFRCHPVSSSLYNTEAGSSSYRLIFRFQLLPTLLHSNAVIFSYRVCDLLWQGLSPCYLNAFEGVQGAIAIAPNKPKSPPATFFLCVRTKKEK